MTEKIKWHLSIITKVVLTLRTPERLSWNPKGPRTTLWKLVHPTASLTSLEHVPKEVFPPFLTRYWCSEQIYTERHVSMRHHVRHWDTPVINKHTLSLWSVQSNGGDRHYTKNPSIDHSKCWILLEIQNGTQQDHKSETRCSSRGQGRFSWGLWKL